MFLNVFMNTSPQASTEEKSIHDNFDTNKQSLEKGLLNRPSPGILVDRGILRNVGKAYSDKMHQLDLAKKRDKLKKKIETRPERDELIRKLILQDSNDEREVQRVRIKQLLDNSFLNRPGSLELVNKNILQVDRLLASKVQNGDIEYPRVLDSIYEDSLLFHTQTPQPQVKITSPPLAIANSHIDVSASLSELSQLITTTANTTNNHKMLVSNNSNSSSASAVGSATISCRKTCKVGKFSFHNVEFHPQKAREYQQNQLLQLQELQDNRVPNMNKLHSELRSCKLSNEKMDKNSAISASNNSVASNEVNVYKFSLLHRLNVNELKSECKMRQIACSNIPKAMLVEKLLPFEKEILSTHASFSGTGKHLTSKRRSPLTSSNNEISPVTNPENSQSSCPSPLNNISSNMAGQPPVNSNFELHQNIPPTYSHSFTNQARIMHSTSEPQINHYNFDFNAVSNGDSLTHRTSTTSYIPHYCMTAQYNNLCTMSALNPSLNTESSNNRHSLILEPNNANVVSSSDLSASFNIPCVQNPHDIQQFGDYSSMSMNHSSRSHHTEMGSFHSASSSSYLSSSGGTAPGIAFNNESHASFLDNANHVSVPPRDHQHNNDTIHITSNLSLSALPVNCGEKFTPIYNELAALSNIIKKMEANYMTNATMSDQTTIEYIGVVERLSNLTREMTELVNKELKFNTMDHNSQIMWLSNLSHFIIPNLPKINQDMKKEVNDIDLILDGIEKEIGNTGDFDFNDFIPENVPYTAKIDDLSNADFQFLSSEEVKFSIDDLNTPEFTNSPMITDDIEDFLNEDF